MARFEREGQTEIERDGFESERFVLDTHTGTYLETSAHVVPDGRRLDSLDPIELFFRVSLVRLPPVEPDGWVSAEALERHAPKAIPGEALLIDTGWGARWDEPGFVERTPAYRPECAEWMRTRRPRLLGVDIPCIDSPREGEQGTTILRDLFEADGILLAPIRLHHVPSDVGRPLHLIALPLRIAGACAAPCRAVVVSGP